MNSMDEKLEIEFAEVRPKIIKLARRFFTAAGIDGDPEDVAQDVLLRLLQARRQGAGISNAEAWTRTVTKNLCVSIWRKAKKSYVLPLSDDFTTKESPSRGIEEAEAEAAVSTALGKISPASRYLLQLRANGLSLDEMAAVTGRPKGSVKSSISTARKEIMRMIKPK